ncbi:MAG: glucose-6-phosphate dehydrogenase assembly protein OpcA [Opitutaceae bacterium]
MPAIFNALPGFEVPMSSVLGTLASLWEMGKPGAKSAPSEFRASQMNLVLHLGHDHTPESARRMFDAVLRFAQRYPCRIVALCPRMSETGSDELGAKVFGECYIGKSRAEMSCCEAVIVGYPNSQRGFLENQVTTLIESDLPLYYWPSRVRSGPKIADYGFFLNQAKRIVIDSAIENETVLAFNWPKPENLRDLADARLLQVRQSVGQFLSSYPPSELIRDLARVEIAAEPGLKAEAGFLRKWVEGNLRACAEDSGGAVSEPVVEVRPSLEEGGSMAMAWVYTDGRSFTWSVDFESGRASIESNLGGTRVSRSSIVRLLTTERALGEALFF